MPGTLPFLTTGRLEELGGADVPGAGEIPVSVWPATSSSTTQSGRYHTHGGEAALEYADELRQPNRQLVVDGVTYKIDAATPMELVPHVVLELVEVSGLS